MGVSGSGKTTFGRALAKTLGWTFLDADDFHSSANREKMSTGSSLTDADREPWLTALNTELRSCHGPEGKACPAVLACSALKQSYRAKLREGVGNLAFIFLHVDPLIVQQRLDVRTNHFFPSGLLQSQLVTLEPPTMEEGGGESPLLTLASAQPLEENIVAAVNWLLGLGASRTMNEGENKPGIVLGGASAPYPSAYE